MRRMIVFLMSLIALLPLACMNTSSSTGGNDTINDEPEILVIEDLKIESVSAVTAYPLGHNNDHQLVRETESPCFCLHLLVRNKADAPYEFVGWSFGKNAPVARDEIGNTYKPITFRSGTSPIAGIGIRVRQHWPLAPGKSEWIAVPFERVVDDAKTITVELPANAFGKKGTFRVKLDMQGEFKVPKPMGWPSTPQPFPLRK